MIKWEYQSVLYNTMDEFALVLKREGKKGWEAWSQKTYPPLDSDKGRIFFKRPKVQQVTAGNAEALGFLQPE